LDALVHPEAYPTRGRRKLLSYLKQGLSYRSQQRAAQKLIFPKRSPLHVILSSFRREANIRFILESMLCLPYVAKVTITNNNPATRVNIGLYAQDSRVELLNQPQATSCGYRFDLARDSADEFFLLVDDDVFLSPQQIDQLYGKFLQDPDSPHGVRGQIWTEESGSGSLTAISGEQEVDVLNQVYLVNRQMLEKMVFLIGKFGFEDCSQLHNTEDLFVSFSGNAKPRIHDVGELLSCPTSHKVGTAIYLKRSAFREERRVVFAKLLALSKDSHVQLSDINGILADLRRSSFE
jgi:hypothetical protein